MTTYLSTRTLGKSANFVPSNTTKKSSLKSSVKNEAKTMLNSSTLENIEIEYIKNLQQQVYFLEMECNYLRQQLDINGLQSKTKYDQASSHLRNEMVSIQTEKNNLEKSLLIENYEKEAVRDILEQKERNYAQERELLLKEIEQLKREKLETEEKLLSKSIELDHTKDNFSAQKMDIYQSLNHLNASETHLEQVRLDNLKLRAELNESRVQLNSRDNLIKEMQQQLADPSRKINISNELKLRNENEYLKTELGILKVKDDGLSKENQKLTTSLEMSLKQNEDDLLLAKKNLDLSKLNASKLTNELENSRIIITNLRTQIEQYKMQEKLEAKNQNALRKRIKELEEVSQDNVSVKESLIHDLQEQLRLKKATFDEERTTLLNENTKLALNFKNFEKKINDLNDVIDKSSMVQKATIESYKAKENSLQGQLDEALMNLKNERNLTKNHQLKIENLDRQDQIYSNMISSLKLRISELESQLSDYSLNKPDLENKLIEAQEKINKLEDEKLRYISHIDLLNTKLNDIDRLKNLENVVQSQRWNELGQLAESMKSLSHTMGTQASLWESVNAHDKSLKSSLNL